MRFAKLTALLVPAITASACYIDIEDPYYTTDYGDITLQYSFDGQSCDRAGVDRIMISLSGRSTGDFYSDNLACNRFDELTLDHMSEDTYDVTIEGRDRSGALLYSLERRIDVDAFRHQSYNLDVPAVMGAFSELSLYWTFEGFGDCLDVSDVRIQLWGPRGTLYEDTTYPCDFGGVLYESVQPGLWSVTLEGLSPSGRSLYVASDRNLDIFAGSNNSYTIDLYTSM